MDAILENMEQGIKDGLVKRCYDCQHYIQGECCKIYEAISVHCECEGPMDGVRVDKDFRCKFYTPNTETPAAPSNTGAQLVRLSLRIADCLHTAMLILGSGARGNFRSEAKMAETELREFINQQNGKDHA